VEHFDFSIWIRHPLRDFVTRFARECSATLKRNSDFRMSSDLERGCWMAEQSGF